MAEIRILGLKEFEKAIKRNPKVILREGQKLIQRTKAKIMGQLKNNPWRLNDSSGIGKGIPVDTGRLRGSLLSKFISPLKAILYINVNQVKYAIDVHEGTSGMRARPFMDRAEKDNMPYVEQQEKKFLNEVVNDLAK